MQGRSLLVLCCYAGFFVGLFFELEGGGDIFIQNLCWLSVDYMALYPGRLFESNKGLDEECFLWDGNLCKLYVML